MSIFGNFKNPSEIFSSFVIAAICQGTRCHSTYDKTVLAATPEVPKVLIASARA